MDSPNEQAGTEPVATAPQAAPSASAKCEYCNKPVKPGTADPANPEYVPKCSLGGADMRQIYNSDTKEEWVCANLAKEAPITMDQYNKWKDLFMKSKFTNRK